MIVSMIRMLMLRVMMELQRVIGGMRNRGERDAGDAKVVRLLMMMQMKVQGLLGGR